VQLSAQQFGEILQALKNASVAGAGSEKRRASRIEMQCKVIAVPFVSPGKPGNPISMLTRDVSFTGIGLMNTVPMEKETLFVVRLPRLKSWMLLLTKVMHCRPLADNLYAIGAEYVEELRTESTLPVDPKAKLEAAKKEATQPAPAKTDAKSPPLVNSSAR
jgi:hypothetical protein